MRLIQRWLPVAFSFLAVSAQASGALLERLGTDVSPRSQSLVLRIDARQKDYDGSTTIALRVKRTVTRFRLHAQELELTTVVLTRAGKPVTIHWTAVGEDQLEIRASKPLPPGDDYSLTIDFKNDLDTQANALYRVRYEDRDYSFSQFEDVQARRAFPCWDEPSFKFPYQVTLRLPASDIAISNTPIARETVDGDWKTVQFQPTKPLPSYLLAIATGPFDTVPIPGMTISGRVVVPKGKAGLAQEAVKACPPILAALEAYFGQPYPYEKLDLLALPEFWYGAMENPGAITFKDRVLLIDPVSNSAARREQLQSVIAHELSHMWFGDLVTMEWWDDLWLNEAFANWMGSKVMEQVYPETLSAAEQVDSVQSAFSVDSLPSARAMRRPVKTQAVLLQAADALAYNKGESVLQMFEQWIGSETFRQGVLAYLETHAWGNARGQDLWNALTKASNVNVSAAMASFLDQPGVPLVTVTVRPGGKVSLSQTRYAFAGLPAPQKQLWRIPVTLRYATAGGIKQRAVLLEKPQLELSLAPGEELLWIHPNADERGYYRWSLDAAGLARLTSARESLSLRERMGLGYALASQLGAGTLSGDAVLQSLGGLTNDSHPRVVASSLSAIESVWEPLADDATRPALRQWLLRSLTPVYQRVGPSVKPGEDVQITRLRPSLLTWLGTEVRDPEVLALAKQQVPLVLESPDAIDPDLRSTFITLAAVDGDDALFTAYRQKFESLSVPDEQTSYLRALGEFRDLALTRRALDYVLTAAIAPSDLFEIPRKVSNDQERQSIAWDWIRANYEAIAQRVPRFALSFMPFFAGGCDSARLDEAKVFFAQANHNVPGTDRSLAQMAEGVTICSTIRKRERPAVKRFLDVQ